MDHDGLLFMYKLCTNVIALTHIFNHT